MIKAFLYNFHRFFGSVWFYLDVKFISLKSHFSRSQEKENFLSFAKLTHLTFISNVFTCFCVFVTPCISSATSTFHSILKECVHYSIQRRDANKRMQFFHIAKILFFKRTFLTANYIKLWNFIYIFLFWFYIYLMFI